MDDGERFAGDRAIFVVIGSYSRADSRPCETATPQLGGEKVPGCVRRFTVSSRGPWIDFSNRCHFSFQIRTLFAIQFFGLFCAENKAVRCRRETRLFCGLPNPPQNCVPRKSARMQFDRNRRESGPFGRPAHRAVRKLLERPFQALLFAASSDPQMGIETLVPSRYRAGRAHARRA